MYKIETKKGTFAMLPFAQPVPPLLALMATGA